MTSKHELLQKLAYHKEIVEKLTTQLESMDKVLELSDNRKPFRKYTVAECQNLWEINPDVFDWSQEKENLDKSIVDYNNSVMKSQRIPLYKPTEEA